MSYPGLRSGVGKLMRKGFEGKEKTEGKPPVSSGEKVGGRLWRRNLSDHLKPNTNLIIPFYQIEQLCCCVWKIK